MSWPAATKWPDDGRWPDEGKWPASGQWPGGEAVLNPLLGESVATTNAGNMFNQASGANQGKLVTQYERPLGRWRQSVAFITQAYLGGRAVRDSDSSVWSSNVGTFEPHAFDNDEHYYITQHVFPSGWKLVQNMVHTDARNYALIPPGSEAPGNGVRTPAVSGATNEASMTYTQTHALANGDALEHFRDGVSGSAVHVLNRWIDVGNPGNLAGSQPICVAVQATLISDAVYSAYVGPLARHPTNGKIALVSNWRETGTATTAEDIFVAFSPDEGVTWFKDPECTISQTVPIDRANCNTIKDTANAEGMWDLPSGCWNPDVASEFAALCMYCTGPGAPHGTADAPHDSEWHVIKSSPGNVWTDYKVGGFEEDTASHYATLGSGIIRNVAELVCCNGLWSVLTGNVTPEFPGFYRFTTADFVTWDRVQISATSGGYCTPIIDRGLQIHRPELLSFVLCNTISVGAPNATVSLSVRTEDMTTWATPVDDGSLWEMVTGAAVFAAFKANRYVSAGAGLASRLTDLTGKQRHFNFPANVNVFDTGGANNAAYVRGNGSSMYGLMSYDAPAPGTRGIYRFSVIRIFSWVSNRALFSGGGTGIVEILTSGVASQIAARNNTLAPVQDAGSSWVLVREYYGGGAGTDSFAVGNGAATTGLTLGNSNPTSFSMFGRSNASAFLDAGLVEQFYATAIPSNEAAIVTAAIAAYSL